MSIILGLESICLKLDRPIWGVLNLTDFDREQKKQWFDLHSQEDMCVTVAWPGYGYGCGSKLQLMLQNGIVSSNMLNFDKRKNGFKANKLFYRTLAY